MDIKLASHAVEFEQWRVGAENLTGGRVDGDEGAGRNWSIMLLLVVPVMAPKARSTYSPTSMHELWSP